MHVVRPRGRPRLRPAQGPLAFPTVTSLTPEGCWSHVSPHYMLGDWTWSRRPTVGQSWQTLLLTACRVSRSDRAHEDALVRVSSGPVCPWTAGAQMSDVPLPLLVHSHPVGGHSWAGVGGLWGHLCPAHMWWGRVLPLGTQPPLQSVGPGPGSLCPPTRASVRTS